MENKVNYIYTINFTNLFHTLRDQGNWKNKAESKKMGSRFFPMKCHGFISVILSQNANHAFILDHL